MTEENSGHLKDLSAMRMRGRQLAEMIRERAAHPSAELDAKVRDETVAFCLYDEQTQMKQLFDSGLSLDLLYPTEIASEVFVVRCFTGQLRNGEIVKFDVGTRQWIHTKEFQEVRRD